MMTHILVRWQGEGKKGNAPVVKMHGCMWAGGWERDFDISEHSGSCDLNPKKEIECVWRRE